MTKIFNPKEWLKTELIDKQNTFRNQEQINVIKNDIVSSIEDIIRQIEVAKLDLTDNYLDWRNIGFALASEFGEFGRSFYHRISCHSLKYHPSECDRQYDKCLKSNSQGITIKSLFHYAKQGNINTINNKWANGIIKETTKSIENTNDQDESNRIFNTPKIPSEIYNQLPDILKESSDMFESGIEKDVFLIGTLSVISGCLPNIEGIYFDEPVSAHLYSFITAPAGSGKGKLKWAKYFGLTIHKKIVKDSINQREEYDKEHEEYQNLNKNQKQGKERPKEPKRKMFFIPANSSSSAFIQALSDNDFKGIVFETEADTLASTLKQDWGNFSDVLRKAFHHESTNMFRRKDNEYIEIEDPHVAIVLSGTPKQVHSMMPDTENGLFSRFIFYAFEDYGEFKNPFASHVKINYIEYFEEQGNKINQLFQQLLHHKTMIEFTFTKEQAEVFTKQFSQLYNKNRLLLGNDFNANSRRLGLITFRIAMVLRSLRILEDGDLSTPLICNETDFKTAIQIAFTLEKHAIAVFQNLPNNNLKGIKLKYYNTLPTEFNRQGYLEVALSLEIKEKAAEKYISQFKEGKLLEHQHNKYTKTANRK